METKQEVFDDLLRVYEEDVASAIVERKTVAVLSNSRAFRRRYAAAGRIQVPEPVMYAIEWFEQNDEQLGEIWRNAYEDLADDWQICPQLRDAEEWMLANQNKFSAAWLSLNMEEVQ